VIHRLDVDSVTLNVREWDSPAAEPPPALLLHGFTGSAATMAGIAGALPSRRVVAPDLIGHGESDCPSDSARYSMAACVTQVVGVLEHLQIPRCDIVGYSMGARVALSLAVTHPSLVRNLVLIGGTPGISPPEERLQRRLADSELADSIARDGVPAFVDRWMAQPLFASQDRLDSVVREAARRQRLANSAVGLAGSLRGMGAGSMPDLTGRLAEIECPTWWIHGAADAKFASLASKAAAAMPNAQVVSIAEAGHAAHLEDPAAVGATIAVALNPPRFPS
jgi:2-succinyl-6-hydroxy-2,4-cyclohexadiene-1-carboxylate synthase